MNVIQQHMQSRTASHTIVLERGVGRGHYWIHFLHVFTFKALLKYLMTTRP